jgi:hypothetical protein
VTGELPCLWKNTCAAFRRSRVKLQACHARYQQKLGKTEVAKKYVSLKTANVIFQKLSFILSRPAMSPMKRQKSIYKF